MSAQVVEPTPVAVVEISRGPSIDQEGTDAASTMRGADTSNASQQEREQRLRRNPANQGIIDAILFVLGWIAAISLTFIVSDLLSSSPLRPVFVTMFLISGSYFVVLARWRNMANASRGAAWQAAVSEQHRSPVLDKEQRRALLTYFVFGGAQAEEEKQEMSGAGLDKHDKTADAAAADAADDGQQTENSPRTPALSPAPSPLPPPSPSNETAPISSLGAAAVAHLTGDADDEEAAGHAEDFIDCEMGLPAAATTDAVTSSASNDFRNAAPNRSPTPIPPPSGGVAVAQDGAKSAAVAKTGFERGNSQQWSTTGSCVVCFGDYCAGERLCRLPCRHVYHAECIDEWLDRANHPCCPLCKADIVASPGDRNNSLAAGVHSSQAVHAHAAVVDAV